MKMIKNILTADKLLSQLNELNFRIITQEQAGEALVFAKKLKVFAKIVEEKVKERSSEIMYHEDVSEIVTDEFKIQNIPATDITEYDPEVVHSTLGDEAYKYMKVLSGRLNAHLKKQTARGKIEMDVVGKLKKNSKVKIKSGFIKISKLNKKEKDES